ncbi:hypothetical protein [Paenibacillus sp. NRS-1781]|uniref:hypothetical protein n=1 Tax=Paenibacillus sp. NRS-1781 TaxID=3233905 RepID=UPI003D274A33
MGLEVNEIRKTDVKTPDFEVCLNGQVLFYCEEKTIEQAETEYMTAEEMERYCDRCQESQEYEMDKDNTYDNMASRINKAIKQFKNVNPNRVYPNVISITNLDDSKGIQDLFIALTGNAMLEDGVYSLFEIMGQYFIGYEAERETVVQTSNTPSMLDEKSTRRILRNYPLGFSTLKKSKEESQSIADQILGKKLWVQVVEHNYVHIIDEQGKVKCIIPRDQAIRRDEGLSFLDFDGATIKFIRIEKVTKSSFKAIVHIE